MRGGTHREKRKPWRARFGTQAWIFLHQLATQWPCRRCRPSLSEWMEGFHDAINVRLGKPLFQAASYGRFAKGELEGRDHPTCVVCLFVRAVLRGVGEIGRQSRSGPNFSSPAQELSGEQMERARAAREGRLRDGGSELTLNVLRILPKTADRFPQASSIESPSDVLRVAMDSADREHHRVLGEVNGAFYYGVATPTVLPLDRRLADQLRTTLELREEAVGIWGPGIIRRRDALYEVWIRLQLCG